MEKQNYSMLTIQRIYLTLAETDKRKNQLQYLIHKTSGKYIQIKIPPLHLKFI